MPTPLTPSDVINAFNAIFNDATTGARRFGPTWHSGNLPPVGGMPTVTRLNSADLGSTAEPNFDVSFIPDTAGDHSIIRIFYVLHNLAMQLTRVRVARNLYTTGSWTHTETSNRAALKAGMELYFPIPAANLPTQGQVVNMAQLQAFINDLNNAVAVRRSNIYYSHVFVTSACHSNCHGSRGRR